MTYLTAITDWMRVWGPIAYGIAFLVGALFSAVIYWVALMIRRRHIDNQFASLALRDGSGNPRNTEFTREAIKLADFFSPWYVPHENKRFVDCDVIGPAMIALGNNTMIRNVTFRQCQVVIMRPGIVYGVVSFTNCLFQGGTMCNVTLLMNRATYDQNMDEEFKRYISIISEAPYEHDAGKTVG